MSIAIKVPAMGESVTEATIARWLKSVGEAVKQDEPVVELETDKVNIEVPSPAAGVLEKIEVPQGGTVGVGSILGQVSEGATGAASLLQKFGRKAKETGQPTAAPPEAPLPPPSVRRIAEEEHLDAAAISGSGKRGQVTKADALAAVEARASPAEPVRVARAPEPSAPSKSISRISSGVGSAFSRTTRIPPYRNP